MASTCPDPGQHDPRPWIRRADQAALAAILLLCLAALVGYWVHHRGHRGGMIDIDRADPRVVRFQVDINTTDWPELTLLPGIGETLARRIIASRDDQGPYLDHSELQRVRGIGPYTLERIRPHLRPIPAAQDMAGQ